MTDVMVQTPPILHGPSEKERKYDRQLRLWAASGQAALESANILLVNSGPGTVGVETLKNLVLPGIGRFTIADETIVGDADLGVNFFLDSSSKGKSRAQSCVELLTELNPDVEGTWHPKDKGTLDLDGLLKTASTFTMILYTLPLREDHIETLSTYAEKNNTPLVAVHSAGFYSYFSINLPGTFPIVDTHPDDTATTDLRLLAPWPQLSEFARDMADDIDGLDNHKHAHLPLVVILLHYLDEWKQGHGGAYPTSYADKTAFRKRITEAMRKDNPEGGEENFEEAVAAVMKHVVAPSLPSSLRQVFEYQHQEEASSGRLLDREHGITANFWIIAEAVKQFYKGHGCLPVPGGLPDMKAESEVYIKLQNLYKSKAREDAEEVLKTAQGMPGGAGIESAEVDLFCTNARFIKLVNSSREEKLSLDKLVERELGNDEMAAIAGPEMPLSLLPIYMALAATAQHPKATWEEIVTSMTSRAPAAGASERWVKAAKEVSRAEGGELHNISAVTGGMVAQEMIKVITKQYIPIDNTCIFDGIESRCQVLRL